MATKKAKEPKSLDVGLDEDVSPKSKPSKATGKKGKKGKKAVKSSDETLAKDVDLDVTLVKDKGAVEGYIIVEGQGVVIGNDDKGKARVPAEPKSHMFTIYLRGPPGASLTYRIVQVSNGVELIGDTIVVEDGDSTAGGEIEFSHR